MTLSDVHPLVIFAAVAAVVFWVKGYIKLPSQAQAARPVVLGSGSQASTMSPNDLIRYGSHALGIAFALAKKAEAEQHVAEEAAKQAGDALHAAYTAPFSTPSPAGPQTGGSVPAGAEPPQAASPAAPSPAPSQS